MAEEFERILDECIDRLSRGDSLQQCLNDYPEHATELKPLLLAMTQTKEAFPFTPSADAKRSARQRFFAALDKKKRTSLWERVTAWQPVWAAAASIAMVFILTIVALNKTSIPIEIPPDEPLPSGIYSTIIPASSSDGNFVFFVSDEENAIGDFTSLFVTIEKVVLLKSGIPEELVEFAPDVKEFDLTLLPGEKTQELWRGNIPEGSYSKVFAYISEVKGVLKATGEEINVKLPSGKLQLTHSFQITPDNTTNFTFDITIVKTGQAGSGKYILKPQASESGTTQTPQPTKNKDKGKPVK
jgi:hypothetical protein